MGGSAIVASCFLLFLMMFAGLFPASNAGVMDDICRASKDPAACYNILKPNPRTAGANLLKLGEITIDIGSQYADGLKDKLGGMLRGSRDPALIPVYKDCIDDYNYASFALRNAARYLDSEDYGSTKTLARAASDQAVACERKFNGRVPERISYDSHNVKEASEILGLVASRLGRG